MDDPPGAHSPLSGLLLFLYILPVMERETLCSVSCLDSRCKTPHFVNQWTFQPISPLLLFSSSSSSSSSFSFCQLFLLLPILSCLLSALYTIFICFNLVAHYSKEKAFCIEKKKHNYFFYSSV